ncbi:hypothetical protein [Streptomyces sp. NRRL S-1448]|uniref:hypothetical protein n=1 Tax=Streptomyces sp. NRRL S-1448 TaxID=1463883 RepID=UPI00068D3033|nr:hypothetical protein [Streptomyces sp. NRRL S-1448]
MKPIEAWRPPGQNPRTAEVKESVRRLLGLEEDAAVVVRELACSDEDCPPLETVIAVLPMDGTPRRWTLHRPVSDITEEDLRALLAREPEGA